MRSERPTAFDLWLTRGLREMYADVVREPISDELLALLDGPRPQD